MRYALIVLCFATSMGLWAFPAHAVEYSQIQAGKSTLHFSYQQMGVSMEGQFRKFNAQLSFDPARPAAARAAFDVELASVDLGSSEADQEVASKPWFNTATFPRASFVSSSIKALGGNRYELSGRLTIKGQTREIVVPVTLTRQGNEGVFDGSFTLRRGDFNIGEGAWAKFDIVANDTKIRFRITSTSK